MKGKLFAGVLVVALSFVLALFAAQARASIGPELAVEDVFSALNSGDIEGALASFSANPTAEHLVRGKHYEGVSEVRQLLEEMFKQGRRLDIVSYDTQGDRVTVQAEISDGGMVWGTETIEVELKDGKVQTFNITAVRLELWKIRQ